MTAAQPARSTSTPWSSLERKLPLLISALVALVVGVYCAASFQEMRRSSVRAATERLGSVSRQLADLSSSTNWQRIGTLRALTRDTVVQRVLAGRPGPTAPVAALLAATQSRRDSTLDGWEIWSADGVRRFALDSARSPRDVELLRAAMRDAARTDSVRRTPLYAVGDQVFVWTVVPARAGDRLAGFLAERRRLANSARTGEQIRGLTGQDASVLFTNRDGSLWTDLRGKPVPPPLVLPDGAATFTAAVRGTGRVFGAQAAVRGTPWVIVMTLPEKAVLRRPLEFLRRMLAIGLGLLVLGAALAWLLGRHVTRPLRAMTGAAEAMTAGNYTQRVAVDRNDELGRLAAAFNAMAARVGDAHSELADRNAALRGANEAKSTFLAMMSHELRTPLNAIGGYTELMELGLRGPVTDAQLEDLARIRRSKDHLVSIITDILDFSRSEAGRLSLMVTDTDIGDVLAEVEALVAPQISAKGLRYEVVGCRSGCAVRADREKLQQVILNLLANAVRFTETGGAVAVTCEALADVIRIQVRDTGIGIPSDKLEAIFEPFVQLDVGLTRRTGGTGLGLAISRDLATAMGGRITVESVVGRGSTFTVTLPRVAAKAAVSPARHVAVSA
jgi:signal transduction histidine kinase